MTSAFHFDPVELPPECQALRREVREFIAGELAAELWVQIAISAAIARPSSAGGWGSAAESA
jgi:hypothetical protein